MRKSVTCDGPRVAYRGQPRAMVRKDLCCCLCLRNASALRTGLAFVSRQPSPQALPLNRIVHLKFNGMRRMFELVDLFHFQLDIAVDQIVVEYAPALQERPIIAQVLERLP
jgi:hypothetical protein